MSSDNIKAALVAAYPDTTEDQWKRRSKTKVVGGVERIFENTVHSVTAATVESTDGQVTIRGMTVTDTAVILKVTPPVKVAHVKAPASKVAAPKAAAPAVKPISLLRNQMVMKSRWTIKQDIVVRMLVSNPEVIRLCEQRDALYKDGNSQHMRGGTMIIVLGGGTPNTAAEKATIAAIQKQINDLPNMIMADKYNITAGTVIEITGKIAAGYKYSDQKETDGLLVPVSVVSGSITDLAPSRWGGRIELPLNQIANIIDPLDIPETLVYVLRDTATGLFFGGWETEQTRHGSRQTDVPKMVPKFSSAKKYVTNSAVKASIRDFTGYTAGMDDADSAGDWYGEYGSVGKKIDLPSTWEMVSFDKPTTTEKEIIDVQNWFKELMRLRVLTKGHGSAVRGVYKKAEGVAGMEAIVVFQNRSRGSYSLRDGTLITYDNAEEFEHQPDEGKSALEAIKKAADAMSGKSLRVKTPSSIAYACSLDDAIVAKLSIRDNGSMDAKVLDINTLEEIVEKQGEPA